MPEIEIRPAVSEDIPKLVALDHTCQTEYVWQMERQLEEGQIGIGFRQVRLPRSIELDYPRPPELLQQGRFNRLALLVAVMGGNPVGYVRLKDDVIPGVAWISDLVVDALARRKGIGTALLLASQHWAIQHSLRRTILEMSSKNHPAIQLAAKLGYEFSGYNDHYYLSQNIAVFFAQFLR
ncbi:MAG: GNAT family N-acetyltransferase [Anaerolineaceae bacterium]|nr:GNAT family N-acetyltransferase [Anaerolineaceae bacterium]